MHRAWRRVRRGLCFGYPCLLKRGWAVGGESGEPTTRTGWWGWWMWWLMFVSLVCWGLVVLSNLGGIRSVI